MSLNSEPDLFDTEEMPRVANGGYDRLEPALNMASEGENECIHIHSEWLHWK